MHSPIDWNHKNLYFAQTSATPNTGQVDVDSASPQAQLPAVSLCPTSSNARIAEDSSPWHVENIRSLEDGIQEKQQAPKIGRYPQHSQRTPSAVGKFEDEIDSFRG